MRLKRFGDFATGVRNDAAVLDRWPIGELTKLVAMADPKDTAASVRRSLEGGETPTRIMSELRRAWPDEYETEFGKDDMAADLGDLGF